MFLSGNAFGQLSIVMGGNNREQANAIVRSFDSLNGGFVLAGFARGDDTNALIIQTRLDGTPVNAVTSVGKLEDIATSMVATSDRHYVITGWTRSYKKKPGDKDKDDMFIIKLREDFSQAWAKVYHVDSTDPDHRAFSIIECSKELGGGYAVTGWHATDPKTHRVIVLRVKEDGSIQWIRTFQPGYTWSEGYSLCEVKGDPNTKFAVVGACLPQGNSLKDAFLLRLRADGTALGTTLFNGKYDDSAQTVAWDNNLKKPGIVVAGWTKSCGEGVPATGNIWVSKFTSAGTKIWANAYSWSKLSEKPENNEQIMGDKSLIVASEVTGGGYALTGCTYSRGPATPDSPNVLLFRVSPDGKLMWGNQGSVHPSYPFDNMSDGGCALVEIPAFPKQGIQENCLAIAGWSNSFGTSNPPTSENFLLSLFLARTGTRPEGCAVQFPMQSNPFNVKPGESVAYTNAGSTGEFKVVPCKPLYRRICKEKIIN